MDQALSALRWEILSIKSNCTLKIIFQNKIRMNSKDETRTTILVILGLLMGVIITLIFVNILIIVFGPGPVNRILFFIIALF